MSENKRWRIFRFLFFKTPVFIAVYILSIGPMAAIVYDASGKPINPEVEKWVGFFYIPLSVAFESSTSFKSYLLTYITFWTKLF
tara:strand:- start:335703 stop:335954 length:252 start_codon:yes stop_codon:yes gene_type:complete